MSLSNELLRHIDESVLCWLATSSASGAPNVSPKEMFAAHGDSVVIANIASPNSARNIRENPAACVAFVNVFTQKGYRVSGRAAVLKQGDPDYEPIEAVFLDMTQGLFPFKSVFKIRAERVSEIIAPRYRLFPETTEEEQIESALRTYGVQLRD